MLPRIPSVSELLDSPPLRSLVNKVNRHVVVTTVRTVLDEMRNEVQSAASDMTFPDVGEMAERIARRVQQREQPFLRPVINATGIPLHPDLGAALSATAAIDEMAAVAHDYANLELDLESGQGTSRMSAVEDLLKQLTGAEAALVVNNSAGATILTLAAVAAGREVIVSRGELIEIDDNCRLPDLISATGALLREVGTTNVTRLEDYRQAVGERTAALMSVHASDFQVSGRTASVPFSQLASLARERQVPLIHDLGLGATFDLADLGLLDQPMAAASIRDGADLVLFSGDKLLGGPQCGIIAGRKPLIEHISRHPLAQAVRVDKFTLAALAVTLRLSRQAESARRDIPLLQLLSTSIENLKNRAERLAPQIAACPAVSSAEAIASSTTLRGWEFPTQHLSTWCISIAPSQGTVERLATALRTGDQSVVGRIHNDRLILDLRAVFPRQDQELVSAIAGLTASPTAGGEPVPSAEVQAPNPPASG